VLLNVTTRDISTSGATFNIFRLNGNTWSQNLQLNWLAYSGPSAPKPNEIPIQTPLTGSIFVPAPSSTNGHVTISINHQEYLEYPIVFAIPRVPGTADSFVISARSVFGSGFNTISTSFNLNIWSATNSWPQGVYVDWILIPRKPIVSPVTSSPVSVTLVTGPLVQEIQQFWRSGYAQSVRLFSGTKDAFVGKKVEISHQIGTIDLGTEVVTRFSTDLKNSATIYTDDNGLELQQRTYNTTHYLEGNYFPMVSRSLMRDVSKNLQLTLLSDSTHGCGGPSEGIVEVMLHRRCFDDDGRGLSESLNDVTIIEPNLWLILEDPIKSAELHRRLSISQQFPLLPIVVNSTSKMPMLGKRFTPIQQALPFNVHLLNLQAVDPNTKDVILRLQHIFEVKEHPVWSLPAQVDLRKLFALPLAIQNVTELNLSANQDKSQVHRLTWLTKDTGSVQYERPSADPYIVILNPMEIRTFRIQLSA